MQRREAFAFRGGEDLDGNVARFDGLCGFYGIVSAYPRATANSNKACRTVR